MIIRQTEKVRNLAAQARTDAATFARMMATALKRYAIVADTPRNYGRPVGEVMNGDNAHYIVNALYDSNVDEISTAMIDCVLTMQVMGDYDCPHCGGRMSNDTCTVCEQLYNIDYV